MHAFLDFQGLLPLPPPELLRTARCRAQALPPAEPSRAGPAPLVAVQPHALEQHTPALAGPAAVAAPGAGSSGEAAPDGGGALALSPGAGGAAGLLAVAGGRDSAVSLAALWCAAWQPRLSKYSERLHKNLWLLMPWCQWWPDSVHPALLLR